MQRRHRHGATVAALAAVIAIGEESIAHGDVDAAVAQSGIQPMDWIEVAYV